ncbi:MAG: glycosyltransferase family 4 protein [Methylococcaceae bacterium]
MRIGLIAPVFLPLISGASLYCFELARALAALGHEIHLFSPPNGKTDSSYILHPILSCQLPDDIELLLNYEMDIWHSLYFVYAPMALHAQPFFVTVHGDDAFSFFVRYRLPLRRTLTRHLLWRMQPTLRDKMNKTLDAIERRYDKYLAAYALNKVTQVIAVSSFTKDRLIKEYASAANRVNVIPPGISELFFKTELNPKQNPRKSKRLLTVTRLDDGYRIKNVHGVISALGLLKDAYDFKYTIISGTVLGNYRNELEQQVQDLGLQEHVVFLGRLSDDDLLSYYQNTDLFVLASYAEPNNFEGFGIVFLEANASGVPVLTTRSGGMADYVIDGENGLYADDPSPQAISRTLERFFKDEVCFDKNKLRGFAQPYRWQNIATQMLALYTTEAVQSKL